MEKDIALGSEGVLKIKFESGIAIIEMTHVHASGSLSLVAKEDARYFLEKLKLAIPGPIDDAIISVIEGAIAVVP